MAVAKLKTPVFINNSNELETGGAPIFADDILRVQENNTADYLNFYDAFRRVLPLLSVPTGPAFQSALILAGLEYDNTDPENPIVSEGYILSGGRICYFPGGTYNTGAINPGLLYIFKGADTVTNRVFDDGGSKPILVEHLAIAELGEIVGGVLQMPAATTITSFDEVAVLQIGLPNDFKGEDYFTVNTAIGVTGLGVHLTEIPFSAASNFLVSVSVGTILPYLISRVDKNGFTEMRGSVKVLAGIQTSSPLQLFRFPQSNIGIFGPIPIFAEFSDSSLERPSLTIDSNGDVFMTEPSGGWPGVDFEIIFNSIVYGSTTPPTGYTYNRATLDIT